MTDHYDALETRDPAEREARQFARLPEIVAARDDARPAGRKHLERLDPDAVNSRAALAKLPVLRKSDLPELQKARAAVRRPHRRRARRASAGSSCRPGRSSSRRAGTTTAGARRARCYAAGFRAGDIVHNSFAYHLTPGGFMWRAARTRSAAPSSPAASATPSSRSRRSRTTARRLCRHAGLPEDPARQGARSRRATCLHRQARLVSGAALPAVAARRARGARRRRAASATPPPTSA